MQATKRTGKEGAYTTSSDTEEDSDSLGYESCESSDVGDLDAIQIALDLRNTTPCCHWLQIYIQIYRQ